MKVIKAFCNCFYVAQTHLALPEPCTLSPLKVLPLMTVEVSVMALVMLLVTVTMSLKLLVVTKVTLLVTVLMTVIF